MPIELTCPCGKQLRVADEFAGRQGQCPACGALVDIPERGAVASGASPAHPEAAQAVTTTRGLADAAERNAPEYAVTAVPPETADRLSPESDISRPAYKLFSPGSIGLVAFLAGPVGAFLLLAVNYWRMGKRGAAWTTVACCVLTMVALMMSVIALPESIPALLIGLPLFLVLWGAAKGLQGSAYDAHLRNGGEPASGWAATGFAVLGIALYFGAFLAYDQYLNASFGQKIDYGGGEEVYYAKGATEADARALGSFLRQAGYFDGKGPKAVRVSLDGNRLVVSLIVQEWVLKDPEAQQELRMMGQQASQRAFSGRPVAVELCDEYFNVKKRL